MRGNGERIGPQNLPTSSIAGGIWNLLNQQRAQQRGAWPSATPAVTTDPYFMYVPLLLNTTSTNGQQNNTFLDSGTANGGVGFPITRNGTPTQGSFTPYQPSGYWSGYFDGSSAYLNNTANAVLSSTSPFTIEFWLYGQSKTTNQMIFTQANSVGAFEMFINTSGVINFGRNNIAVDLTIPSANWNLNTWQHIAIVREGTGSNQYKAYVNGTLVSTGTLSASLTFNGFYIGAATWYSGGFYLNGYISNLRVVNGTAVYTSAFTPSTTPLTAITNTSLLTLQSNRFIDNGTANSGSGFPITVNGTPKVQAFQPFAPAASYSAATYGGSGYFGGSDYLSLASNAALAFGTGDFTIESWIYLTSLSASNTICDNRTADTASAYVFYVQSNGTLTFYDGAGGADRTSSAGAIKANTWYHVVATRSGTTFNLYINGAVAATNTGVSSNFGSSQPLRIGQQVSGTASWNGYISNLRLVKGTPVYTGAFTPPTLAPLTTAGSTSAASYPSTTNVNTSFAAANTSLLTNFTNAGIYDAAWQNNALTVGDAQVSTTQAQWPTTSIKFDGTGDYLSLISSPGLDVNNGDFTIEGWVYPVAATNYNGIIALGNAIAGGFASIRLRMNSSQQLELYISSNGSSWATFGTTTNTIPLNAWTYLALVRSGSGSGNVKLYINGTASSLALTFTGSGYTGGQYSLGCVWSSSVATEFWNGYIQDLRITKGVARTITTPTAAFPTR